MRITVLCSFALAYLLVFADDLPAQHAPPPQAVPPNAAAPPMAPGAAAPPMATGAATPDLAAGPAQHQTEFDETRAGEISMYSRAKLPPTILKYDQEKDEFLYGVSTVAGTVHRPGAPSAYYGSRLTQYRFIGPPGRGGIYDAIEWYNRVHNLNPLKYQYRFR